MVEPKALAKLERSQFHSLMQAPRSERQLRSQKVFHHMTADGMAYRLGLAHA